MSVPNPTKPWGGQARSGQRQPPAVAGDGRRRSPQIGATTPPRGGFYELMDRRSDGGRSSEEPEAAFEDMLVAFQNRIFAFTLALSGDRSDAEELTQETFLRAWKAMRTWDDQRRTDLKVSPWLHRIALNLLRRQRHPGRPLMVRLGDDIASRSEPGPEAWQQRRARLDRLAAMVAALPAAQRNAVAVHCVQGLSYRESAAFLGRPEATLRSDVRRGLAVLRSGRVGCTDVFREAI